MTETPHDSKPTSLPAEWSYQGKILEALRMVQKEDDIWRTTRGLAMALDLPQSSTYVACATLRKKGLIRSETYSGRVHWRLV